MSTPVLYAMLTDDALRNITAKIDTSFSFNQGYGVLQGEYGNYFNSTYILTDSRKNRLSVLDSTAPYGAMNLLYDGDRFDSTLLDTLTDTELTCLLNIIERCYLKQGYTDANLEHLLRNTASFNGYVENSYGRDTTEGTVTIYDTNKVSYQVVLNNWFTFEFKSSTNQFRLHVWLSSKSFGSEYPYTTITSVIPPCDPSLLGTPTLLSQQGVITLLQSSSSYIFSDMHAETLARDQNGVCIFKTKYVMDGQTTIQLPFALPYRGAHEPDNLECRQAIKDYLLANTDLTPGDIQSLFPELFIDSRFFIIPLWDLYSETCDRRIYNSIYSYQKILEKITAVFGHHDTTYIETYLEFLTNAQNTMISICLPDELNTGNTSILAQHPTYQNYATSSSGFRYMDALTQEFAALLYRAFAALIGEASTVEFTTTELDGSTYLVFTNGMSEYLIMTRESYEALVG